MDKYTVLLKQGKKQKDITAYVSGLTRRDDSGAYSSEVSFKVAVNNHDRFLSKLQIEVKDGVIIQNNGKKTFDGFVISVSAAGQVECRDDGFYLKNEVTIQFTNCRADTAMAQVCKRAGVTYGWRGSWNSTISGEYIREQASSIIDDILEQVNFQTDRYYAHRIIDGALCVTPYDTEVTNAKFTRPASASTNITWAIGEVEATTSMEDMATNIIVQTDDNDKTVTLTRCWDDEYVNKYGMLTKYITVDADKKNTAATTLAAALEEYDNLKQTARIPRIWGNDDIVPGKLLMFNSPDWGISGRWWVSSVTHTYEPYHLMSLELIKTHMPRIVTYVTVPPKPDTTVPTSTTTRKALGRFKLTFYAGDTITASGKKPRINHTIAVDPNVIKLGSQVYIDGWGTYTAEDTGRLIKGNRIDIFVSSKSIARKYGVKYADVYKITTSETPITPTGGGTAAQKFVNVALKEEGYKELGGNDNRTKYGAWYGYNGVAWCAIFVSWCAAHAGISTGVIPKMASVSSYMSWYKARKKFRYKGSYRPKCGDLMIQKSAGASHVGIVIKSDSNRFYTIEGNSSNRVARRSYPHNDAKLTGFCTPWG